MGILSVEAQRGSTSQPTRALEELHREHGVAARLLERLRQLGERLRSGEPVDARTVRFGVGLLDAYVHRVHASQMEDRELGPEARPIGVPVCLEQLDRIRTTHTEMRRSARALLELLRPSTSGGGPSRTVVGDALIDLVRLDRDAVAYEETHPLVCLDSALPRSADRRLSTRFSDHAGTRAALEANIERFLSGTIPS